MEWSPQEETEEVRDWGRGCWVVKRPGLGPCPPTPSPTRCGQRLTRFLATYSSFIQVCSFWSARSTSFWHMMSSDTSASKTDCSGERIQGQVWGRAGKGPSAWDPQEFQP